MCFRFPSLQTLFLHLPRSLQQAVLSITRDLLFVFASAILVVASPLALLAAPARTLRVCADPDNLPFSNRAGEGFENHIAQLVARNLNANLSYEWQRMGRGFVREVLGKSRCDLLIGIPVGFPGVLTTAPYYRSGYVFVTRRDAASPTSLDDQRLRQWKIAVQALDEEYSPPATALARRRLQSTLVGFYTVGTGAAPMLRAVADHQVDVAIIWGPLAGFPVATKFARLFTLTPVSPEFDPPRLPLTFQIAMGVRKSDAALRDELQQFLNDHASEIQRILADYHVPLLPLHPQPQAVPNSTVTVIGSPAK